MARLSVITKQETEQTVSVTIHGPDKGSGPTLLGYLEITATPRGASVTGWHADDSLADDQIVLRGE